MRRIVFIVAAFFTINPSLSLYGMQRPEQELSDDAKLAFFPLGLASTLAITPCLATQKIATRLGWDSENSGIPEFGKKVLTVCALYGLSNFRLFLDRSAPITAADAVPPAILFAGLALHDRMQLPRVLSKKTVLKIITDGKDDERTADLRTSGYIARICCQLVGTGLLAGIGCGQLLSLVPESYQNLASAALVPATGVACFYANVRLFEDDPIVPITRYCFNNNHLGAWSVLRLFGYCDGEKYSPYGNYSECLKQSPQLAKACLEFMASDKNITKRKLGSAAEYMAPLLETDPETCLKFLRNYFICWKGEAYRRWETPDSLAELYQAIVDTNNESLIAEIMHESFTKDLKLFEDLKDTSKFNVLHTRAERENAYKYGAGNAEPYIESIKSLNVQSSLLSSAFLLHKGSLKNFLANCRIIYHILNESTAANNQLVGQLFQGCMQWQEYDCVPMLIFASHLTLGDWYYAVNDSRVSKSETKNVLAHEIHDYVARSKKDKINKQSCRMIVQCRKGIQNYGFIGKKDPYGETHLIAQHDLSKKLGEPAVAHTIFEYLAPYTTSIRHTRDSWKSQLGQCSHYQPNSLVGISFEEI